MDIFEQLKNEHEQVKTIMEQIKETDIKGGRKRESLFKKLQSQLVPHEKAEEKVFYPLLLKEEDAREDAMEALEEHHFANMAIKELDRMSKTDEHWLPKFNVMSEMVQHHIEEEETKVFDDAHRHMNGGQSQDLTRQFTTQEKQIRQMIAK